MITHLTRGPDAHYPLYYFVPSHTPDGRYLVLHRERDDEVQLVRLDQETGETRQITRGQSRNCGWQIWDRVDVNGVYDHLSAMSSAHPVLAWFEDSGGRPGELEVRLAHVPTLETKRLAALPGRIPVGQPCFSPDGNLFACLHAERERWQAGLAGRDRVLGDHERWRQRTPVTCSVFDTRSGNEEYRHDIPFHVHHVLFVDASHLLLNHDRDGNGMWSLSLERGVFSHRSLRPRNRNGRVCHQIVTKRGIFYEAWDRWGDTMPTQGGVLNWPEGDYGETLLPERGYTHTGNDPEGLLRFYEVAGRRHLLYQLHADNTHTVLAELPPYPHPGQRWHAHPFIGPRRDGICFTLEVEGRSQVARIPLPLSK